jgi:hypothetical protein
MKVGQGREDKWHRRAGLFLLCCAIAVVIAVFWFGIEQERSQSQWWKQFKSDCAAQGGQPVRVGAAAWLCVSSDGRIIPIS